MDGVFELQLVEKRRPLCALNGWSSVMKNRLRRVPQDLLRDEKTHDTANTLRGGKTDLVLRSSVSFPLHLQR